MTSSTEFGEMTLMRVRRAAQLTLPADIRQALNVQEGDYLEASITPEGVLLKPVAVVQREQAWRRILDATAQVKPAHPDQQNDIETIEQEIVEDVKNYRRKHRHG